MDATEEGWTYYPCGCGSKGDHFVCCSAHYFRYSGPVEHLAREAHRRAHGIGSAWWDKAEAS